MKTKSTILYPPPIFDFDYIKIKINLIIIAVMFFTFTLYKQNIPKIVNFLKITCKFFYKKLKYSISKKIWERRQYFILLESL